MPFDFDRNPLNIFALFPNTPFPLEVSIYGYCQMACTYCFANRNRDVKEQSLNLKNSGPSLFNRLESCRTNPESLIGFFLREKYPICFSNTTDPFQREEQRYRLSEAFLSWSKTNQVPVHIQTRGNVLLEDWNRYEKILTPGLHTVYMSICQLDDKIRKKYEPGALNIDERFELIRRLSNHGIPVVAAVNPYVRPWISSPEAYCQRSLEAGAKGIWLDFLHLSPKQEKVLPKGYHSLGDLANIPDTLKEMELARWLKATAELGLDFFPTPHWDAFLGFHAKHPECVAPEWLGRNTFHYFFSVLKSLHKCYLDVKQPLIFSWDAITDALEYWSLKNPVLKTYELWYAYNCNVNSDFEEYSACVGKTASLYEMLRFFFNHPVENESCLWYAPGMQILFEDGEPIRSENNDLIAVYDPTQRHSGILDREITEFDFDAAVPWSIDFLTQGVV